MDHSGGRDRQLNRKEEHKRWQQKRAKSESREQGQQRSAERYDTNDKNAQIVGVVWFV